MKLGKPRNYAAYVKQVIYLPHHISTSTQCIVKLAEEYLKDLVLTSLHGSLIGISLKKNCIVRLHGKYFIVRRQTPDLNIVSPLSEAEEIKIVLRKIKKLREVEKKTEIVFIDVGAHIGKIILSDHVDKVIAIEPDPRNYTLLRYNLELNNVTNAIALRVAASSERRSVKLIIDDVYTSASRVMNGESNLPHIVVQALPLDDLLDKLELLHQRTYVTY